MNRTFGEDDKRDNPRDLDELLNDLRTQQNELETQNSALRKMHNNLLESEKRFTDLFDFAPVGYGTLDENGNIVEANITLSDMLRISRTKLINLRFDELVDISDRNSYFKHRESLLTTRHTQRFELRLKRADHSVFDAAIENVISVEIDGDLGQSRLVVIDISQRKSLEREKSALEAQLRQSQKMQALGTMAGGIAHEFNNLLAVIFGCVDIARIDLVKQRHIGTHLDRIQQSGERARQLVKQILAFSRKNERSPTPINLSTTLYNFKSFITASLPSSIHLNWDICKTQCPVIIDLSELHQVLINLCMNSVYAMNESGTLTIQSKRMFLDRKEMSFLENSGEYVILKVEDTGCGMNGVTKERIFEPFYTTKPVGQGTGMGLALVYSVVQRASGTIHVESCPNRGSTFTLYFPISDKPEPQRSRSAPDTGIHGKECILLVEDDEILASTNKEMLERLGYRVTLKTDGEQALDVFYSDSSTFDLMITDQVMPNLTGIELAKSVLALRPDFPIILCTGYSSQTDEAMAKAIGIARFAIKPLTMQETGAMIRQLLDNRTSRNT